MNPLEEWYDYERLTIQVLTVVMGLFFTGIALNELSVANPLTDFVYTYYLDPISGESTGDSGYNMVNTMTYGAVLAMFAIALSGWLRHLGIDPSDKTLLALLPFVLWAAFGEVVEDAEMFGEFFSAWFVSPGVHFQTAGWVVIAGWAGYSISSSDSDDEKKKDNVRSVSALIIFAQFILYGASINGSGKVAELDIDLTLMMLFSGLALAVPWLLESSAEAFDSVQRTVYFSGVGGGVVLFGALASFMATKDLSQLNLWPVAVVIGAPVLLCMWMLEQGREAAAELAEFDIVAGILPPGMNEDEYLASESKEKDLIESLRLKATMAYPVAFLPVAGQVLDGLATWIGIDGFPGYGEKHVLSQRVIDGGLWVNEKLGIEHEMLDEGVWLFAILKFLIGGIVFWFYSMANFEYRQQHLRMLIGLALMVVGMAPGLRDVGRLMLGV
ncbi:MAG: DUF63 family protein [Candidatus Thalassarchaeaceae archaeon]|nr:DUF63 family protein [Candidatus Thalassarchaeaceae archaeon]